MYEKFMKQTGAYQRPFYREVNETEISSGDKRIKVKDIVVEVKVSDGTFKFQGDEISQNRLARIGWAMDKTNTNTKLWKTFDNKVVKLSQIDIARIIMAASEKQDNIWLKKKV